MLLTLNIGNTHTKVGLYDGARAVQQWRLTSDPARPPDEWGALLYALWAAAGVDPAMIHGAVCASVVPPLTAAFTYWVQRELGCELLVVNASIPLGLGVRVDQPLMVGADRLANAVAARALVGAPCVALDAGTATTFNVVDPAGDFVGGAIAPGLGTTADALAGRGAQLFHVDLVPPAHAIGRNTGEAMQSGIVWGYVGLVEGLLTRIAAEGAAAGWPPLPVVATGGFAPLLATFTPALPQVVPDLTLDGLRQIYALNRET